MTRIVLLDVDGVLNQARSRSAAEKRAKREPETVYGAPRRRYIWTAQGQFPVIWSPSLVEELRRIARETDSQWWWCTTWDTETVYLERELHIAWFEGVMPVPDPREQRHWKEKAARDWLEKGYEVAWVDDVYARDLTTKDGQRMLAIKPDEHYGLTRQQVAELEAFLKS